MKQIRPVITILGLSVFFLGIAIVFTPQFEIFGEWVMLHGGLRGLFVTTFLLDYAIQPFPPDIPLYSFILSGSPFFLTVIGTGIASVFGAVFGYWTGRLLEYEGAVKFIGKKRYGQAHQLFIDHGFMAIFVAALTPVPFNVVSWSAGVFKMPFDRFLLSVIVTRLPRFFLVGGLAILMT